MSGGLALVMAQQDSILQAPPLKLILSPQAHPQGGCDVLRGPGEGEEREGGFGRGVAVHLGAWPPDQPPRCWSLQVGFRQ